MTRLETILEDAVASVNEDFGIIGLRVRLTRLPECQPDKPAYALCCTGEAVAGYRKQLCFTIEQQTLRVAAGNIGRSWSVSFPSATELEIGYTYGILLNMIEVLLSSNCPCQAN